MVADGTFRSDLYYRLNVYTIALPPLGERGEDLPLLVDHFLARANQELGKQIRTLAPEGLELLRRYPWPGNVRQLQSVLKQAALRTTGPTVLADFLPELIQAGSNGDATAASLPEETVDWDRFLAQRLEAGTESLYDEAVSRLGEVAKNFLWPPINPINCANVIVNERAWNSLPDDLKVSLEQAVIIAGLNHTYHQNWTGEQWGLTQMKKAGVKLNELKGEELKRAEKAAMELWEKEAKRSPASAKMVEMTKEYMRAMGYLE